MRLRPAADLPRLLPRHGEPSPGRRAGVDAPRREGQPGGVGRVHEHLRGDRRRSPSCRPTGSSTKAQWVSLLIGIGLFVLGIAMLFGYRLPFTTPQLDVGRRDRSVRSMYVFGIAYAVASIGCTIAPFTGVVLGSFSTKGLRTGVGAIALYGVGMALVVTALTVTLAFANTALLHVLRRGMAWVEQVAGVLLILTGALPVLVLVQQHHRRHRREQSSPRPTGWQRKLSNFVAGAPVRRSSWWARSSSWPQSSRRSGCNDASRRHDRSVRRAAGHERRAGGLRTAQPHRVHGLPRRLTRGADRRDRQPRRRTQRCQLLRRAATRRSAVAHPVAQGHADVVIAAARRFIDHVDIVITIHGFGRRDHFTAVLLGRPEPRSRRSRCRPPPATPPAVRGRHRARPDPEGPARPAPRQPGEPAGTTRACRSSCRRASAAPARSGPTGITPRWSRTWPR